MRQTKHSPASGSHRRSRCRGLILCALLVGLPLWGTGTTAVAADHAAPAASTIVAERHSDANDGHGEIVSVRPDGTHLRVLTTGHDDLVPDLSPDGRLVTFERCVDAVGCDQEGAINIYAMRSDATHVHALTHCVPGSDCLGSFDPSFSPDGSLIAFARDQLDNKGVNSQGIFVMRVDGTHLRRVTSNGPDALPDGLPRFAPDGRSLVFSHEMPDGGGQLMTVRVDGTHLRELLPGVTGFDPDWAPSGRRVAFTLVRGTDPDVTRDAATVSGPGDHVRPLTATAGTGTFVFQPDWAPDGSQLVLSRVDSRGCTLVTMSARGGEMRPVETGGGCTLNPSWSSSPRSHERG